MMTTGYSVLSVISAPIMPRTIRRPAVEVVERPDDRTVQITYDIQGDGDTDRIETYTLDESGDRIRVDVDTDADGNTDRVERYEVDADGNRNRTDFDDDGDGDIDRSETSTRDPDSNRSGPIFDDGDGDIDRGETSTRDPDSNQVRPISTTTATAISTAARPHSLIRDGCGPVHDRPDFGRRSPTAISTG